MIQIPTIVFLLLFTGGLLSGICEARVEPTAFRLLCEANRNHTGRLGTFVIGVVTVIRSSCVSCCFVEQKMVEEADVFPAVLQRVVDWLQERELGTKYKYAILTDGYV